MGLLQNTTACVSPGSGGSCFGMLRSQREKGRSNCGWFSQDRQIFSNDVRDVGALSDGALDERRGLPAIAALRAAPLVLRRAVLSEMKAVRSADVVFTRPPSPQLSLGLKRYGTWHCIT